MARFIFILNILFFILFIYTKSNNIDIIKHLALFPIENEHYLPIQWITHMFLHANFMHIFSNMLMYIFLAKKVEEYFGKYNFLFFYIFCGICAAFAQMYFSPGVMVGASGAIFGVISAILMIKPKSTLYLFGILPLKTYIIIPSIFILELYNTYTSMGDGIGHYAHIFGFIAGILYYIIHYFNRNIKTNF